MIPAAHLAALLLVALAAAGCGRAHLNPAQGRAYRQVFAAQQVTPPSQWRAPSTALDPQEASVISRSHTQSLAGKKAVEPPEPVIFVAPQRAGPSTPLAPSVPKE